MLNKKKLEQKNFYDLHFNNFTWEEQTVKGLHIWFPEHPLDTGLDDPDDPEFDDPSVWIGLGTVW